MAAYNRPTSASYVLHEQITVDTTDHEDHTFCGVMFPVECKKGLPIDHMVISSLSVRGALGPMTVWVSNKEEEASEKKKKKANEEDQKLPAVEATNPNTSITTTASNNVPPQCSMSSPQPPVRRMVTRSSTSSSASTMATTTIAAAASVVTPSNPRPSVARAASSPAVASGATNKKQRCGSKGGGGSSPTTAKKKKLRRQRRKKIVHIRIHPKKWTKIYQQTHEPQTMRHFVELVLDTPIKLQQEETRGIYVHSALEGDEGIVYDNQKAQFTHDDNFLKIRPGLAHLCSRPFGRTTLWGYGSAWRESREFVGRVNYGIVYKLWNPELYYKFGPHFQTATRTLFMCQRRAQSPLSKMPDDVIFYILNMCRWDWFDDTAEEVKLSAEQYEQRMEVKRQASEETSSDESDDSDEDQSLEDYEAARRVSRTRGHWSSRSRYSFLSGFGGRNRMLMGALGFDDDDDNDDLIGSDNRNVQFIHEAHDDSESSDNSDNESEDDPGDIYTIRGAGDGGALQSVLQHLMYDRLHTDDDDDEEEEWVPSD